MPRTSRDIPGPSNRSASPSMEIHTHVQAPFLGRFGPPADGFRRTARVDRECRGLRLWLLRLLLERIVRL